MYTLSSYLQYSYNNNQEKEYLQEEVNSYKKVNFIFLIKENIKIS